MVNGSDLDYTMARTVTVLALMVLLAAVVESRDWRFKSAKRVRRGYNNGFSSDGTYGRSDEQNASVSKERLKSCSGEGDDGYGGSRDHLAFNRDGRPNENPRGHRSFSKTSASATASSSSQKHNIAI